MDFTWIWPVILAFTLTAVQGPVVIPFLLRLKVGQTEREEGPDSHKKKNGTPTMGGIMILLSVVVTSLLSLSSHPDILPVLILTVGFGLIGFLDDYIKVVLKRNLGLRAWQKLVLQFVVTGFFAWYLLFISKIGLEMQVPFTQKFISLGILNIPCLFFVVLGTVNGTNFTDGLDGLASTVTSVVALFFVAAAIMKESTVTPFAAAMLGALLGFLLFNLHPAKVFMGDTGSLALGGFVAGCAYMLHMPLFIMMVGIIYLTEVLSVIIQVGYFKATHGKRVFRMAPIHHHFELGGWSETRVVGIFSIITFLFCLVALFAM